jgi:hypothetical protein
MVGASKFILLRGGRVLIFDSEKNATFPTLNILMEDTTISKIARSLR